MTFPSTSLAIRKYWQWLSFFHVTLIVHVIAYILAPDVGQSSAFRLLAVGWFLLAFLVFGFTLYVSKQTVSTTFLERIQGIYPVYLIGSLIVLFLFGVLMRIEWVYVHGGLALSSTVALGYLTFFSDRTLTVLSKPVVMVFGLVGLVFLLLKVNAIAVYPHIIPTDESWLLGWPVAWVRGLYPDDLLFYRGGEDVFHYFIPMGIWMQIVGTGFVQARVYQLLMTIVLMGVTFPLVTRLYDRQTAWLTVCMLFAGSVMVLATTIRHDIGLGILLVVSFLVYQLAVERDQIRLHFVAGLIVGFGLFTHYHAIAFGPALMLTLYTPTYVRDFKQRGWKPSRQLILYAIGGLIGAGIVFTVQILPQIDAVIAAREFRSSDFVNSIISYFEYFGVLAELSRFEFVLIMAGMIGLVIRRQLIDVQVLLMILLGNLGLALLAAQITLEYYVIPLAPFYAMAVVTLFTRSLRWAKPLVGWVALFFVVVNLGFVMSTPIKYALDGKSWDDAPEPVGVRWIKQNVPAGATIIGDIYYFLWLTDYEFYASTSDRYVSPKYREDYPTSRDLWIDVEADYIVVDPNIPTYDMQRVLDSGFLDDNEDYEIIEQIAGQRGDMIIWGRVTQN